MSTIEITDEMIVVAERHVAPLEESNDTRKAIEDVVAIIERDYKLTKLCGEELAPGLRCTREVYGEPHRGDHEGITSTGNKVSWSAT